MKKPYATIESFLKTSRYPTVARVLASVEDVRLPKTPEEYEKEVQRLEEVLEITTSDAQGLIDAALMNAGIDPVKFGYE